MTNRLDPLYFCGPAWTHCRKWGLWANDTDDVILSLGRLHFFWIRIPVHKIVRPWYKRWFDWRVS